MKKRKKKKSNGLLFLRIITGVILIIMVALAKFYPDKCTENMEKTIYYTAKHNFDITEFKKMAKDFGIFND